MLQIHEPFRVQITALGGDVMVLDLVGELDMVTMPRFDAALHTLISAEPRHVLFDLSRTEFICGAGYAAIGRISFEVDRVTVRSKRGFAQKILQLLGYDRVEFVTLRCLAGIDRAASLETTVLSPSPAPGSPTGELHVHEADLNDLHPVSRKL